MERFLCDCGNRLFFENVQCLACGREVGWCPACATLTAMAETAGGVQCARCGSALQRCANRVNHDVCNRSVVMANGADPAVSPLCDCCRYNGTIPDLSVPGNLERWRMLEQAKRRLIYSLDGLGLPHGAAADGFDPGLSFDFKGDSIEPAGLWRSVGAAERVFTGHDGGKITINIREADAVEREKLRVDLGEAHRTLIGHFRHEIGHYYWDLLIAGNPDMEPRFRALFGDHENPSYGEALERHYAEGPPADWQKSHISAYATMHPWEDWAETFAFYLDIRDVMETAAASGLIAVGLDADFDGLLKTYTRLGILLNELNRAVGLIDFLPGLVVPDVVAKLQFIHDVIAGASQTNRPLEAPAEC